MKEEKIQLTSMQELVIDEQGFCFIVDAYYKEVLIYDLPSLIRKLVEVNNANTPHMENHLILINND